MKFAIWSPHLMKHATLLVSNTNEMIDGLIGDADILVSKKYMIVLSWKLQPLRKMEKQGHNVSLFIKLTKKKTFLCSV